MNQFKRAKQKALESGHHVEDIGDLKTAGVKEPLKENIKETEEQTTKVEEKHIEIVEQEIEQSQSTPVVEVSKVTEPIIEKQNEPEPQELHADNTIVNQTIEVEKVPEPQVVEEPAEQFNKTPEEVMIQPEEKYVMPEVQPEVPINDQITASHTVTEAQTVYQTQTHTEPVPQVVYQPEATDIPQPTAVQAPSHTTSNVVEPPIHTTEIPVQTPVSQITEPIPTPAYIPAEPEYTEPSTVRRSTGSRKSIPNIFSPKGEAKSMRKSLVLKPTSVKIAENYCAKNGGSFNELIQTLLDNFIDEYGL